MADGNVEFAEEASERTSSTCAVCDPDPDTIKMFIGQIPRAWNEENCKRLLEEFGPIYQLNILRDKVTNVSRGCGFVTFYHRKDAISAQNALHNVRTLPEMHHPIQMKPADGENRNERKLFVGMLSKTMGEEDVREMFKEFGSIEECSVLREPANGTSRGCCFVTFSSRGCALSAIRKMHHSVTLEGCSKPLVVKFADTQRDKEGRKSKDARNSPSTTQGPLLNDILNQASSNSHHGHELTNQLASFNALLQQPGLVPLLTSVLARVTELAKGQHQPKTSSLINQAASSSSLGPPAAAQITLQQQQQQAIQALMQQQKSISEPMFAADSNTMGLWAQLLLAQQLQLQQSQQMPKPQMPFDEFGALVGPCASLQLTGELAFGHTEQRILNPSSQLAVGMLADSKARVLPPLGLATTGAFPPANLAACPISSTATSSSSGTSNNSADQVKGPEGCNLFIYHIPQDYTDDDLYAIFVHFGTVLSAKVFVDKQTNLSKCFGFVSFTSPVAAQNAITAMNGFQIGCKRLKVQLKRSAGVGERPYPDVRSSNPK